MRTRVKLVKVSYIVLLSEPNTHIGQAINDGNNLSQPAGEDLFFDE